MDDSRSRSGSWMFPPLIPRCLGRVSLLLLFESCPLWSTISEILPNRRWGRVLTLALTGFRSGHLGTLSWYVRTDELPCCGSWQHGSVASLYPSMQFMWLYTEPAYGLSILSPSLPQVSSLIWIITWTHSCTCWLEEEDGIMHRKQGNDRFTSHLLKTWLHCFSSPISQKIAIHIWKLL